MNHDHLSLLVACSHIEGHNFKYCHLGQLGVHQSLEMN